MICDKVEEYCRAAGLTIARFEKLCGIGNGTIGKWRNHNAVPSIATLIKLENATGIPIYMWIEGSKL